MAQVIRYVDTDVVGGTGDGTSWANAYSSLSTWEAAEETNLDSANNYMTVYCKASSGTADSTFCEIDGWTTSAAGYIEIIGFDFPANGLFDDTKYVLSSSDTHALEINENYVRVHNLQIKVTLTGSSVGNGIYVQDQVLGGCDIRIDSCFIKGVISSTGAGSGLYLFETTAYVRVYNTIIEGFINGADSGYRGITAGYDQHLYAYNCTIYNCYYGILSLNFSYVTAKNCAVGNCTDDFCNQGAAFTVDYCCSDDGDGTNAQNPSGGSWNNEFNDPGNGDFRLKTSGNCFDNGMDDPGGGLYSDDIIGTARSSSWDIGAFEFGGYSLGMTITVTATISFELSTSGIAPMLGRWTWPIAEKLVFNTEILQSHDRTEQRIARRRGVAANYLSTKIFLEGDSEITRFEGILHNWLRKPWRVPVWPMADIHTGELAAGSSTISFDTRFADFRANSYAVIWQDRDNNEVVFVSSKTDSSLILTGVTAGSYSGDKFIMPCRTGRCISTARPVRYGGGALVDIEFRIEDVEAIGGFTADMTYDGYTVLTEPARLFVDGQRFEHDPDIALLDDGTGPFEVVRNANYNLINQQHGWSCEDKQKAWELRQFLYDIKGRQSAFLVPSFRRDMELTRPVGTAETSLYINNCQLAGNLGANDLRTYLAFRPPYSDIIVRKITDISGVSDAEEKITINTSPGTAFGSGDKLCLVDRCRLASDDIELTWHGRGRCTADTPLIKVTA